MAKRFLSMMEAKLPPGFRFHPRDEELINDYLAKKVTGESSSCPMMVDVDLNKVEPWDLPEIACVGGKEWYFYSLRDKKYATGQRTNRATSSGYWKATGKDRRVVDDKRGGKLVGMRKTLVFYNGRAPKGKKSEWVMHEFRMEASSCEHQKSSASSASFKEDWVLCRVFYKSRCHSPKPNSSENCYDDTGSSSLPPLTDTTYISFEQSQHGNDFHAYYNEQVSCFSNPHQGTAVAAFHRPPPPLRTLPNLGSYNLNMLNYSSEKKLDFKAVVDCFTGVREERRTTSTCLAESSESFLTEAGGHSMWNTFDEHV